MSGVGDRQGSKRRSTGSTDPMEADAELLGGAPTQPPVLYMSLTLQALEGRVASISMEFERHMKFIMDWREEVKV